MPFLSCMPVSPTYAHYKERPLMPSRNLRKRTSSQAYFNLELLPRDALTHQAGDVHVAWFNSWLLALQALSLMCTLYTCYQTNSDHEIKATFGQHGTEERLMSTIRVGGLTFLFYFNPWTACGLSPLSSLPWSNLSANFINLRNWTI